MKYTLNQWFLRCAPVHTSVHDFFFTVHRKNCKTKTIFKIPEHMFNETFTKFESSELVEIDQV